MCKFRPIGTNSTSSVINVYFFESFTRAITRLGNWKSFFTPGLISALWLPPEWDLRSPVRTCCDVWGEGPQEGAVSDRPPRGAKYRRGIRKRLCRLENPRSIQGNMCGTCQHTLIAALFTIRTSLTRRSATLMDPNLAILERSRCRCKETVSVKKRRGGTEIMEIFCIQSKLS